MSVLLTAPFPSVARQNSSRVEIFKEVYVHVYMYVYIIHDEVSSQTTIIMGDVHVYTLLLIRLALPTITQPTELPCG